MPRRILIADDSEKTLEQISALLADEPDVKIETARDGRAAFDLIEQASYSLFLTDLKMPGMDGMALVKAIRERNLPVTVVVMTGFGSVDQAVEAMRLGAYDFLTKPVDPDHLRLVVQRALRERALLDEVVQLREAMLGKQGFHNVLSKSPRMHSIFDLIANVAQTTTTVLITGETGTGKEQVARAIHDAGRSQRSGELIAVNCAALPETLLESELFGHEKGSFTGATGTRKGRFELADGGTIFLDEAGDIPLPMQAKLLRVLQERKFERVGGVQSIEVDVRVIAATNRDLLRLVRKGKFREDLYYRLNVVKIDLPPLRERIEDVPLLATHFATKYARPGQPTKGFSPAAMERLLGFSWPGNVRQLENAIERACVTARGPVIEADDLPPELSAPVPLKDADRDVDLSRKLPELIRDVSTNVEKEYLTKALTKTRGNVGRCAQLAGLSRRSISAKLAEYGINKDDYKRKKTV
jgi:DNA-binding NtrC family response regulator